MSKTTEDLGSVIDKLEDIKSELETHNSENFTYFTRDGDDYCGYYGFNIMDKRKFRTLCDELRKELGLEKDE